MAIINRRADSRPATSTIRIHRMVFLWALLFVIGLVFLAGSTGSKNTGSGNSPPEHDPSDLFLGVPIRDVEQDDVGPAAYCGDGKCNGSENIATCEKDCGGGYTPPDFGGGDQKVDPGGSNGSSDGPAGGPEDDEELIFPGEGWDNPDCPCGDGVCNWDCEDTVTCRADCGDYCGDTVCAPSEINTCLRDCPLIVTCGDGICSAFESNGSCPEDCFCGNTTCDPGETPDNCSADCLEAVCGDGQCTGDENKKRCPSDCADQVCGDEVCTTSELETCPTDCTPDKTCGDGQCTGIENGDNCQQDCGGGAGGSTGDSFKEGEEGSGGSANKGGDGGDDESSTDDSENDKNRTGDGGESSGGGSEADEDDEASSNGDDGDGESSSGDDVNAEDDQTADSSENVEEGCRIIERGDMTVDIVTEFERNAEDDYSAPYYMVCDEPPEVIAIPEDPDVTVNEDDIERLTLLDCTSDECEDYDASLIENKLYVTLTQFIDGEPTCAQGCAFAIAPDEKSVVERLGGVGLPSAPLILLVAGVVLVSVFLFVRTQ